MLANLLPNGTVKSTIQKFGDGQFSTYRVQFAFRVPKSGQQVQMLHGLVGPHHQGVDSLLYLIVQHCRSLNGVPVRGSHIFCIEYVKVT